MVTLFHLKDKSIQYTLNGTLVPDWFGIDSHGTPFLFESKGASGSKVSEDTLLKAKRQLASIRSVTDKSGMNSINYQSFRRHVIVSCFRDDHNIKDRWYIQDIDPQGEGTEDLIIDLDKACFKYYSTFVSFLDSCNMQREEIEIKQQKYIFFYGENEKFGIHESIYDAVHSVKYPEENGFNNFNKKTKEVLDLIECKNSIGDMDDSSSFKDGIIVCSRSAKFN